MKRLLPLLLLLVLPLCGCQAAWPAVKIGYYVVKAAVKVIDLVTSDEPEPEEGEDNVD